MSKLDKLVFVFVSFFLTAHAIAQTHTLVQGWNLEGNDNGAAVDPNAIFGNATTPTSISPSVTTVWTWDKNALKWNFFAPGMTPAALATYAASKGYGVLTTIPQGQGFWVNANTAVSVNLAVVPAATGVTFSGTLGGYNSVTNTNGSIVGGKTVTTGSMYTWLDPNGGTAALSYDPANTLSGLLFLWVSHMAQHAGLVPVT